MAEENCLVVLGPTAGGKTALGTRLASRLGGVVLSVDSRQVYRGLDLGAGKDLSEYFDEAGRPIPHRLIDNVDLDREYNLFDFQTDFFRAFEETLDQGRLPVVVGGTGLYLEAVLEPYDLVSAPPDPEMREELEQFTSDELEARLRASKKRLHNTSDFVSRERMIRAIEIAETEGEGTGNEAPEIRPLILGIHWERAPLRKRIGERLRERLKAGLIEEVRKLHEEGISWERLESLGLEYRYVSKRLKGEIPNDNDLFQKLHAAINQFSKRQMTWFRRMEKKGARIHWVPEGDFETAWRIVEKIDWKLDSKSIS